MALPLTTDQKNFLRREALDATVLLTFLFDSGTYRFCDDVMDCTYGGNTFIGASAFAEMTDIRGGQGMSAESVTLTIDGNRLGQSGFTDPASLFRTILAEKYKGRRVNIAIGVKAPNEPNINFIWPAYAGRINYLVWTDEGVEGPDSGATEPAVGKLDIVLDSIAARYRRATYRTRSDPDQQELYPGDRFYQYVTQIGSQEQSLYWGRKPPKSVGASGGVFGGLLGAAPILTWNSRTGRFNFPK